MVGYIKRLFKKREKTYFRLDYKLTDDNGNIRNGYVFINDDDGFYSVLGKIYNKK